MKFYKVRTTAGYYWSTGSGSRRYGRFTANEDQAFIVCENHANKIKSVLEGMASTDLVEVEHDGDCDDCEKRVGLR